MSGHLCLKWNNHSTAFLKNLNIIQTKEKFCDSTIVCQGKYFPVHRMILSTCSEYFDEIFERIQCQHPYVIFKDIEPGEMELLLNYMYQGEINVIQERLPSLIKAAEALKIKGLAVPDDLPSNKDSSSNKKRSSTEDTSQPKNKKRYHHNHSSQSNVQIESNNELDGPKANQQADISEFQEKVIKKEPEEVYTVPVEDPTPPVANKGQRLDNNDFSTLPTAESGPNMYIKNELGSPNEDTNDICEDQPTTWNDFSSSGEGLENFPASELSGHDEAVYDNTQETSESVISSQMSSVPSTPESTRETPVGHWRSRDKNHVCPYCPYKTTIKVNFLRHIRCTHFKMRPFPCSACSLRCATKTDLQRHMLIHTGEKPFQCTHCGKYFRRRWVLKTHSLACGGLV